MHESEEEGSQTTSVGEGATGASSAVVECLVTSAVCFEQVAKGNIAWYCSDKKAWLTRGAEGDWSGWVVETGARVEGLSDWTPWTRLLDESDAPFYRWFVNAQTNAAFSEVDRHILDGHGAELAFIEEGDPMVAGDESSQITRYDLFLRSAAAAQQLRCAHGLAPGDRVLFFAPAGLEQIVWIEACKRLAVVYCCCSPGLPPEQIADRVYALRAKLVITVEHPEWSYVVHKALNNFMPVVDALLLAASLPGAAEGDGARLEARWACRHTVPLAELPLHAARHKEAEESGVLLGARVLLLAAQRVPMNLVHRKMPKPEIRAETSTAAPLPAAGAAAAGVAAAASAGQCLTGAEAAARVWRAHGAPVAVEANFPLFVIFTSGTTGKPKGLCHAHAYVAGLAETMKVVFNADPATDRMLTVGNLGWITGQSYQVSAPLVSRITAVVMRGNPVRPKQSRFAEVINRQRVTIFKAGSAFLREVMSNIEAMSEVRAQSTREQLRIATFCAEPLSSAVQEFAMEAICKNYINSYWATEHGGIVWSRLYNDSAQPLKADTRSWPMPWIDASIYVFGAEEEGGEDAMWSASTAEAGQRAEVVLTAPYPYMFRHVWGDAMNFGRPGWTGDRSTMLRKYWRKTRIPSGAVQWVYVQGDLGVRYADNAYTFHGRSDEVLNVNGVLFGTEHLEGAILRDKQRNPSSPVGHCVVVGYPDGIAGEVPLACIVHERACRGDNGSHTPLADELSSEDIMRLYNLVCECVGSVHIKFIVVSVLPQTFSGKFMRRLLRCIACNEPLGDTSALANAECIPKLKAEFLEWARLQVP